ncbi:TIM barrel protein [Pseudomonas sp.]|uniref:sugar phosphate isomerase/epimerase family protein n=1 Tax=Pseudomonas sp. TaxID=306 RepID=UPI002588BEA0|nr:TIM barrel protein [Pseudomonas sp.]
MHCPPARFTMPFSNVLHLSVVDKFAATAAAGFTEIALQPQEIIRLHRQGVTVADLIAMAADHGVRINRLDPLCTWNPDWQPGNMGSAFVDDHRVSAAAFFRLAEQLGCEYMSLNATFRAGAYPHGQLVEYFADICSRAREHGLFCDLEPIPMWGVRSLEQGWEVVRDADQRNGGLVVDTLHFVRSQSSLDTLSLIPGDLIHCVQICDGALPLPPGRTLEQDCFERQWPGTGQFPLHDIIAALHRHGGLNHQVGPEVFSAANSELDAHQVAALCRSSLAHYPLVGHSVPTRQPVAI